ncbi:MAG: gamma-glutamyl-gamma-aminobutyrate hydrolase family protein [Myxococcota bacterium]
MRPRIGITGPDHGGYPAWVFTAWGVRFSGGRPVRITPRRGLPREPVDGLVVGGGADIEPHRYAPHAVAPPMREQLEGSKTKVRILGGYLIAPLVYIVRRVFSLKRDGAPRMDPARDALEAELLEHALQAGLPILGICRGAQLLNVVLGGNLHQDVTGFYVESANPWTVFPAKQVRIDASSRLARLLGTTRTWVNSLHRQAVDDLGDGLIVVAREDNGVVQGVELPDRPFVLGVQWHPEYLPQRPEQRRLFDILVQTARERRTERELRHAELAESRP